MAKIVKYDAYLRAKGSWIKPELYIEKITEFRLKLFDPPKMKDFVMKHLEKTS